VYLTSARPALETLYEVNALAAAPAGVLWQVQPRAQ
jgi:hypothetical protein